MNKVATLIMLILVMLTATPVSQANMSIEDIVRLKGYGSSQIWGIGLVVGLNGTGDSGEILPVARPLAKLLERAGNPVPNLEELTDAQSIALVMVTCDLPEHAVKSGDQYNASVKTMFAASSLEGGQLLVTPLRGPLPGQGVYAFSWGELNVSDLNTPTSASITAGVRMSEDINKPIIEDGNRITLHLRTPYVSENMASTVASLINQAEDRGEGPIARAWSAREVELTIPTDEMANPIEFIGRVLTTRFDESLVDLPARVVISEPDGPITITGDVSISPAVISHNDLVVTTVEPEFPPTPANPRVTQSTSLMVDTTGDERTRASAAELLQVLEQLQVPVGDQIEILKQLHRAGHLHAELIIQ